MGSETAPQSGTLYHSSNIVRVIKSRRLKWAGHVVRMEEGRSAFKILTGNLQGIDLIRSQEKNLNHNRDSNLGPPDF